MGKEATAVVQVNPMEQVGAELWTFGCQAEGKSVHAGRGAFSNSHKDV